MTTTIVSLDDGKEYEINTEKLPNGKWITRVGPKGSPGDYVREPTVDGKPGKPVEADSDEEAFKNGTDDAAAGMAD